MRSDAFALDSTALGSDESTHLNEARSSSRFRVHGNSTIAWLRTRPLDG